MRTSFHPTIKSCSKLLNKFRVGCQLFSSASDSFPDEPCTQQQGFFLIFVYYLILFALLIYADAIYRLFRFPDFLFVYRILRIIQRRKSFSSNSLPRFLMFLNKCKFLTKIIGHIINLCNFRL